MRITKLLFASGNKGKIQEVRAIFADLALELLDLSQVKLASMEVAETGSDFQSNALIKAKAYGEKAQVLTLSEDSGLVVDALNGQPGVYSKRFGQSDLERCSKVLTLLKKADNRTARFVCAACLYDPSTHTNVIKEGVVKGTIAQEMKGDSGFGYDPIFIPSEVSDQLTFAQLGPDQKNVISHRRRAIEQLKPLLGLG